MNDTRLAVCYGNIRPRALAKYNRLPGAIGNKINFSALLGETVMVCVPEGEPRQTKTLFMPSLTVPSVVLKVELVPDNVSVTLPLKQCQ